MHHDFTVISLLGHRLVVTQCVCAITTSRFATKLTKGIFHICMEWIQAFDRAVLHSPLQSQPLISFALNQRTHFYCYLYIVRVGHFDTIFFALQILFSPDCHNRAHKSEYKKLTRHERKKHAKMMNMAQKKTILKRTAFAWVDV